MLWPWPLTYFKVKVVAGLGTTILWICLLLVQQLCTFVDAKVKVTRWHSIKMHSQQFLFYLSLTLSHICLVGSTWQGNKLIQISWTWVKGQGHKYTSLANLLYAFSLLLFNEFQWNLAGTERVLCPLILLIFRFVRHRARSQWDKIEKVVNARVCKWHNIL